MNRQETTDSAFRIVVLVLPESSLMCVASALEPFRAANRVSDASAYAWSLASLDGRAVPLTCQIDLPVEFELSPQLYGDLLLVIGGFNQKKHVNADGLARIRKAASRFGSVAGVEAGSWVIGRAGLLNGKSATTHWEDFEEFSNAFPDTEVKRDRYVIDDGVMTCGGASPAFDMMLQVIRQHLGNAVALDVASVFIYNESRPHFDEQSAISLGSLFEQDPKVSNGIRLMETHIEQPLPIAAIARRAGMSVKTMELRFKRAIGQTPGQYYLGLRLGTALRLVRNTELSMREIAIRTGFGSLSAFSRAYSRHFGTSAKQARAAARMPQKSVS